MPHISRTLIALFLGLFAAACASPRFAADVVRFHQWPDGAKGEGRSVAVMPANPALEGLEFAPVADIVGRRLAALGFAPPRQDGTADLLALVDFSVGRRAALQDEGRDSPVRVGIGVGSVGRHSGVSVGGIFGVGGSKKPDASFVRTLSVQLKDAASNAVLFEGRATSFGREDDILMVMPYLADAVFEGFPGRSGVTTRFERAMKAASPGY
ncbi:MAG: DUF4136 domain-containing protein [Pseudomonadota bacterium]